MTTKKTRGGKNVRPFYRPAGHFIHSLVHISETGYEVPGYPQREHGSPLPSASFMYPRLPRWIQICQPQYVDLCTLGVWYAFEGKKKLKLVGQWHPYVSSIHSSLLQGNCDGKPQIFSTAHTCYLEPIPQTSHSHKLLPQNNLHPQSRYTDHSPALKASRPSLRCFPHFREPVYYRAHYSPLVPISNQMNRVHGPPSLFLRSTLIWSIHLRLGLPSGPLPSVFPLRSIPFKPVCFHVAFFKIPPTVPTLSLQPHA